MKTIFVALAFCTLAGNSTLADWKYQCIYLTDTMGSMYLTKQARPYTLAFNGIGHCHETGPHSQDL